MADFNLLDFASKTFTRITISLFNGSFKSYCIAAFMVTMFIKTSIESDRRPTMLCEGQQYYRGTIHCGSDVREYGYWLEYRY